MVRKDAMVTVVCEVRMSPVVYYIYRNMLDDDEHYYLYGGYLRWQGVEEKELEIDRSLIILNR